MQKTLSWIAVFFLSGVWASVSTITIAGEKAVPAKPDRVITAKDVFPHIEFLAAPEQAGRRGPAIVHSQNYIATHFETSGLKPLFTGSWFQDVPGRQRPDGTRGPTGKNIGAFVEGTDPELKDEWIIINAHYDHLGTFQGRVYHGADDNASGVSMLLEVAKQVQKSPLRRSVAFVAFDFEETLLWGSRWFVAHPPMELQQIRFSLTADMIGRSLGDLDLPWVFVLGAERSKELRIALKDVPAPEGLFVARLGTDIIGSRSDYVPFRMEQIPFLFFSTGEHPDYHQFTDTADKIDADKVGRISTLILELVTHLGNADQGPEWSEEVHQKLEEAELMHRVALKILENDERGIRQLSNLNRFLISQIASKTGHMLKRGTVSDSERKWLIRSGQFLMLTAF